MKYLPYLLIAVLVMCFAPIAEAQVKGDAAPTEKPVWVEQRTKEIKKDKEQKKEIVEKRKKKAKKAKKKKKAKYKTKGKKVKKKLKKAKTRK